MGWVSVVYGSVCLMVIITFVYLNRWVHVVIHFLIIDAHDKL